MFINQEIYYSTDTYMKIANQIRYWLHTSVYSDQAYIQELVNLISKYIDCLDASYDAINKSITIKIKKTSMKKRHGFRHEPTYYYPIMCQVFRDLFFNHQSLMDNYIFGHSYMNNSNSLLNDNCVLTNLCFVSCISDNIISIKL